MQYNEGRNLVVKKKPSLTSFKGAIERSHSEGGATTGFSWVTLPYRYVHHDKFIPHYYILFLISGECRISCSLFHDEILPEHHALLIPKGSPMTFKALCAMELLVLAFDMPLIATDRQLLEHCCRQGTEHSYTYSILPIHQPILQELGTLISRMQENKIKDMRYYCLKNQEMFICFESYYKQNEVAAFLFPIVSGTSDFKSFILNNYAQVDGSIKILIQLSGLSERGFRSKFARVFGMPAKQWMMQRQATQLNDLAAKPDMTPGELVSQMGLSGNPELARLCRRYFSCTAWQLILSKRN